MGRRTKQIAAVILAIAMCLSFATAATAYNDYYPNTHRNTGHHIADLIAVARTQLGYTELSTRTGLPLSDDQDGGYTKYGASFGDSTGPWCAYFVSWCATQAGIPTSIVPRLGNCVTAVNWYKARSQYYSSGTGYIPKTGDIIFYNWSGGSSAQHIGIVTGVSGDSVYTIEGNTDSSEGIRCAGKTRSRTAGYIIGYGVPAYNDSGTYVGSYSFASSFSSSAASRSQSIAYSSSRLSVITTSATDITSTNAVLNGSVENPGRLFTTASGFFFGTNSLAMKKYSIVSSTSSSSITLKMDVAKKTGTQLSPNSTYYFQSFVTVDGRDYLGPTYAIVTVNDKPQQIVLSESSVNVGVGQTTEVMAAQLPLGSLDKGITWSSADETIATVSDGVIMGVGYGKVIVTAKTNYGDKSSQCVVNVLIPTPQNIKLENVSENRIKMTWDKVEGAKGYVIYRADPENSTFEEYEKLGGNKTSFEDDNIEPGVRYYYQIKTLAKSEEYDSDISKAYYTNAKLSAPQNVYVNNFIASSVRVTWNEVEGAKNYRVFRAEKIDGLYTAVGSVKSTGFVDTNTAADKQYFYKIIAENGNLKTASDYSETASVVVKPANLGIPEFQLPSSDKSRDERSLFFSTFKF